MKADDRADQPMWVDEQAEENPAAPSDNTVDEEVVNKLVETMVPQPKHDAKSKRKGKEKGKGQGQGTSKGKGKGWQERRKGSSKGIGKYQDSGKNNAEWAKNGYTPPGTAGGKSKGKGKKKEKPGKKGGHW